MEIKPKPRSWKIKNDKEVLMEISLDINRAKRVWSGWAWELQSVAGTLSLEISLYPKSYPGSTDPTNQVSAIMLFTSIASAGGSRLVKFALWTTASGSSRSMVTRTQRRPIWG